MKINKSNLFKIANGIYRTNTVSSFSEALSKAWAAMKLQTKLVAGSATFRYLKSNGEVRNAVGTLKNMINETNPGFRAGAENILFYFDLEKKGFRSFNAATLIIA